MCVNRPEAVSDSFDVCNMRPVFFDRVLDIFEVNANRIVEAHNAFSTHFM